MLASFAYLAMPFDLIPDFIPVIGHLDDFIVVVLLTGIAVKIIPSELKREIRSTLDLDHES